MYEKCKSCIMGLFESKEQMIRTLNAWDGKTFGEAVLAIHDDEESAASLAMLKLVLDKQKLFDKPMNGYASENLKKDEFENMGVCYVDFFNKLEQSGMPWTPLDVLHEVCKNNLSRRAFYEKKAKKYGMTFERVTWLMCGRALRALPSFIREYQLKNEMMDAFKKAFFEQDEELDRKFHCDIKMTLNGQEYYVWSFLSSPRAIYQFVDKFRGNRYGHVNDGNHILCPFDRNEESATNYKGWSFYSDSYINEIRTAIYQKEPLEYDNINGGIMFNVNTFRRPIVVHKSTPVQAAISQI